MPKNEPKILCTAALGQELLNKVNDRGVHLDVFPFINIQSVNNYEPILQAGQPNAFVVFTSANAVHTVATAFKGVFPTWQIACIGHATAREIALHTNKNNIIACADNALELASHIIALKEIKEVVFFCGDIRRNDLPQALGIAGIHVNEVVVYHTLPQRPVIDGFYDAILFFSPSAAEAYFSCNLPPAATVFFAIGTTTAAAISKHTANTVVVGPLPEKEELLLLALSYFQNNKINA